MDKLLIVDDEKAICTSLKFAFEDQYHIHIANNTMELASFLENEVPEIVLLDLRFGEVSGLDLLGQILEKSRDAVVIMMTAYGTIETSIEAIKKGAYDYIMKPLDLIKLRVLLSKAAAFRAMQEKIDYLQREVHDRYSVAGIIGRSEKMKRVLDLVHKVKDIDINVLIQGPTGTGKELVARAIHYEGRRKGGRFEALNCGAIPESLMESELFGYEKGAFTHAQKRKRGKFELAHGGTIFLDEIGEMDPNLQVKLLRAIQQKEIVPLGSEESIRVDVRIIAATNKDLRTEVEAGRFREDLFFRLNVVNIDMPGLNERREDIPVLTEHFIKKHRDELSDHPVKGITKEALKALESHDFLGNVRELENLIERAMALTDHEYLRLEDLPRKTFEEKMTPHVLEGADWIPVKVGMSMAEVEEQVIKKTLGAMDNNKRKTAEVLGISERSLRYKVKAYRE